MRHKTLSAALVLTLSLFSHSLYLGGAGAGGWTLVGWNNLGMHCMDSDYTVFSILPPYNTVQAHLMDASGRLVRIPSGVTVTYEALADPTGSINSTSANKTTFWLQLFNLFGATLPVDTGLAGSRMPGAANQPQPMRFDASVNAFVAEGIPITPYDDAGQKNPYPMMHLVARAAGGNILATTDIVLPVSDEMDCRACHASGSAAAGQPLDGWIYDADPERDYRLNILRLHDEKNGGSADFRAALDAAGYDSSGLYPTAVDRNKAVLCARCHSSNALPGTGIGTILPLTRAMHAFHAHVLDPTNGQTLDASANRSACYRCHPGGETRCLRGAMGTAVAADGSFEIQCQNCHGTMNRVGSSGRQGWLDEPNCQNCHTGTALNNSGQIRFTSAFGASGLPRVPTDTTFATNPNTPAAGTSLYRFSSGHGGLQCSACHHSTHAEYPSSHRNDNIQALQLQNHVGTISECPTCHNVQPNTVNGGPHGMHPIGQAWANSHEEAVERGGSTACQRCHGRDYGGTVLSRSLGNRTVSTKFGAKQFWRGSQIGCYTCHNGPGSERANPNPAPAVSDDTVAVSNGTPATFPLKASSPGGNPLQLRVVTQPAHGTVGINGTTATYYSLGGYAGADSFTFAASDGALDSNLGTIALDVTQSFLVPFYQTGPSTYTGLAVTNYSGSSANIQFTAFGTDGQPLALPRNPSGFTLQSHAQLAKVGEEIFGTGASPAQGWIRMTADSTEIGCFFQFGSTAQLDGSVAQTQAAKHFRFTRVFEGPKAFHGQDAVTHISIANPTSQPVTLSLNLLGPDPGQVLASTRTESIPASGFLYRSISDLFGQGISVSSAHVDVQVTSGDGAVGFELIEFPGVKTVLGLNAVSEWGASAFYSAQLANTADYFTHIKLTNVSDSPRTISLQGTSDDGTPLAPAAKLRLSAGQSVEQDAVQALALNPAAAVIGSLAVSSDGPGVLGDVLFGDPRSMNFAASFPLQTRRVKQAVFHHVANADGYFTGLALFNPNQAAATVTLEVYAETGAKTGQATLQLGANSRISKLLTQLVPASTGQMRGFITLRSTQPLIAQQLFGDSGMNFLSAVPPGAIQ